MPNIKFNVSVYLENAGVLPELEARMSDLSPAFSAMFEEWTSLNQQKFEQSVGREMSGAEIFEEHWAALSPAYMAEKHNEGKSKVTKAMVRGKKAAKFDRAYPDWLMVRSGALRAALTNPDALFQDIKEQEATFGTPNDSDLADIIRWQAGERQHERNIIFLSTPDMNMIKRILQDFLSMGGNFSEMRSAKGLAAVNAQAGTAELDAGFDFATGGE